MDLGFENEPIVDTNNQQPENNDGQDNQSKQDLDGDKHQFDSDGNPIENLDNKDTDKQDHTNEEPNKNKNNNVEDFDLKAGEVIEIGSDSYTVADNGDLLDKDGNVFKESKDVQEYLKSLQLEESDDKNKDPKGALNIKNIQEALGYEIIDENEKPIEYENNIEGIKTYMDDVIEQRTNEIQTATLNTLFEKFPFAQHIINYYIANGGSLEGWNVEVDRSNITIDDSNEKQQEEIVRTAWREQKRTGDLDGYIAYLKSSGTLLNTAKLELKGLQDSDKNRKETLQRQAQEAHAKAEQEQIMFWNEVGNVIKSRKIAGYTIPEQIKVNRGGKAYMVTPTDFYKYISVVDQNGETAYAKDCKAVSPEQQLNDSLLRAYIMFTGGDYSSLVDMAVKDKEVKTIRFKAANSKQPTRRFTPKSNSSKTGQEIDLGYN